MISVGSVVPVLLVGALALYSLWQTSKHEIAKSLEGRAQLVAVALEKWIDTQRQSLDLIAAYHNAGQALPSDYFRFMMSTHPHWVDLRVFNRKSQNVLTWPPHTDPLPPKLTEELLSQLGEDQSWVIGTDWSQSAKTPILILAVLFERGDTVVIRARAEALKAVFQDLELPDGSNLSVFDQQGRVLYHSAEEVVGVDITTSPVFKALESQHTALLEAPSPFDGVPHVYGLARAGRTGCIVKAGLPSATLYQPAWEQFTSYLMYSVLALFCSLITAILIAHGIARPIRRLSHLAHRLGKDGVIVSRERHGRGEVAELSEAFYLMAERIKEREESLKVLNKRLEELNELKSDAVSGISHELRTPLTTIKTLSRLMLRNELSEDERKESLEVISIECDRQIDLVLNLLDLSRIEAGAFYYALSDVDLLDVLHACVKIERHAVKLHGHDLVVNLPEELPLTRTDRKAVRRILCVLIENAIKYTPDGGRITLAAHHEGDQVVIEVSDTGRGIASDDLPHIFDKFYRGRQTATVESDGSQPMEDVDDDFIPEVPGVGLGLYVAHSIIKQLGGQISVVSEIGRGTTFTLRLPVTR